MLTQAQGRTLYDELEAELATKPAQPSDCPVEDMEQQELDDACWNDCTRQYNPHHDEDRHVTATDYWSSKTPEIAV